MSKSMSSGTELVGAHAAPESEKKFDRLKALLREMFQLDRGDLDFGLYRVMNMKAREIRAFLDNDLLPQVKTVLAGVADEERARIDDELEDTIKQLTALKAPLEDNEKVLGLRARLAEAKADADAEADVYGHLANFFARYYDEGDFMPLRRYSGGGRSAYLIPYDGEEVKLHWANADQYYIKTTENYAAYAFTTNEGGAERRVRFEIAAADNEKDNVKEADGKQRRFVLAKHRNAVVRDGDDLIVRFEHRPLRVRPETLCTDYRRSRMDASLMKASALRLRFSQSLASRRQRLSQAMVRSTTQRLGWTTKPFTRSDRLTISVSRSGRMPARAR